MKISEKKKIKKSSIACSFDMPVSSHSYFSRQRSCHIQI